MIAKIQALPKAQRRILFALIAVVLVVAWIAPFLAWMVGVNSVAQIVLEYIAIITASGLFAHFLVRATYYVHATKNYGLAIQVVSWGIGFVIMIAVIATHLHFFLHVLRTVL